MNWTPLAISFGAVLGALSRYYITLFWVEKKGVEFPYGTLFVNLTGAGLIGFISVVANQNGLPVPLQQLMLVGFLGSYTTFSSYILDSASLFQRRNNLVGLMYWLGSPVLGFLMVELGLLMAQRLS